MGNLRGARPAAAGELPPWGFRSAFNSMVFGFLGTGAVSRQKAFGRQGALCLLEVRAHKAEPPAPPREARSPHAREAASWVPCWDVGLGGR